MSFVARAHPQQVDRPDPLQPTFEGLEQEPYDLDVDDRATTPEDFARFDAVVQKELELYSTYPNFTFHFDIVSASELEEPASLNAAR